MAKKFKQDLLNYAGSLRHTFAQEIEQIDGNAIMRNLSQIGERDDLGGEAMDDDD